MVTAEYDDSMAFFPGGSHHERWWLQQDGGKNVSSINDGHGATPTALHDYCPAHSTGVGSIIDGQWKQLPFTVCQLGRKKHYCCSILM
jgi:hypothetical protein